MYLLITPQPCALIAEADLLCTEIRVSADGPAYLPWLAMLPLIGALAAYAARRLGARPAHRLFAAVSPALYGAGMFVVGLASGFFWRIPVY